MSQETGKLTVQLRVKQGKGVARKLRAAGRIPGVVYGGGGDNLTISLDPLAMRKAMDPERRLNTFWTLDVVDADGNSKGQATCVLADFQLAPLRDQFLHVDFLRVSADAPVTVKIPVEYTGRAKGSVLGGKLRTLRRSVRVAAKPTEIPVKLVVDVTPIGLGESLRLSDLSIPNAEILDQADTVMALVEAPRGKKEDAPAGK
jgi:large subunit ribosomal protein L25